MSIVMMLFVACTQTCCLEADGTSYVASSCRSGDGAIGSVSKNAAKGERQCRALAENFGKDTDDTDTGDSDSGDSDSGDSDTGDSDAGNLCQVPITATPSADYPQVHVRLGFDTSSCSMGSGYDPKGIVTMDLDGSGTGSVAKGWDIFHASSGDVIHEYNGFTGASTTDPLQLTLYNDTHGHVTLTLAFDPNNPSLLGVTWPDGSVSE